jgi:hypothetical protein
MQPVQILADHDPGADPVVPEAGIPRGDGLIQHRLVVTVETELVSVPGRAVAGRISIVDFLWKGGHEQFFVFAAVRSVAGGAAIGRGCRLMHGWHFQSLLDIRHPFSLFALLHVDILVMTA